MNSWNEGYFTDSAYVYGYYREQSPNFMRWCLLVNGFMSPEITENSCHCELGFGQGLSANIHAAATPGKFFGTDFNPAHAANANELATISGTNAKFFEDSFDEFYKRDDLPKFDSISLHGIWSWVSAENRQHIVEIARQHLNSGGVLYNSYNCLPGWAPAAPLRELFALYDKTNVGGGSNTKERVESALNFIGEMIDAEPAYTNIAPNFKTSFERLKDLDRDYIAHEYLNDIWDLMYFTDVVELLQTAKLNYATTAMPIEGESMYLPEKVRDFLGKFDNPIMIEQLKDYFINRQFRKDLFVRGVRRMMPMEVFERVFDMRYVLITPAEKVPMEFSTSVVKLNLSEEIYRPLLEFLAEDNFRPKNLVEYAVRNQQPPPTILEAIKVLVTMGNVMPCQSDAASKLVKKSCERLNAYICERARYVEGINFLASPLTGLGVNVNRFQQLFLAQYKRGEKSVDRLTNFVWETLARQGQKIIYQGKTLETPEENIAHIKTLAENFLSQELTIFKVLGL